jgi:hypothetical protein
MHIICIGWLYVILMAGQSHLTDSDEALAANTVIPLQRNDGR